MTDAMDTLRRSPSASESGGRSLTSERSHDLDRMIRPPLDLRRHPDRCSQDRKTPRHGRSCRTTGGPGSGTRIRRHGRARPRSWWRLARPSPAPGPLSASRRPFKCFARVVFPEPLPPTTARYSPLSIASVTPLSASTPDSYVNLAS